VSHLWNHRIYPCALHARPLLRCILSLHYLTFGTFWDVEGASFPFITSSCVTISVNSTMLYSSWVKLTSKSSLSHSSWGIPTIVGPVRLYRPSNDTFPLFWYSLWVFTVHVSPSIFELWLSYQMISRWWSYGLSISPTHIPILEKQM